MGVVDLDNKFPLLGKPGKNLELGVAVRPQIIWGFEPYSFYSELIGRRCP